MKIKKRLNTKIKSWILVYSVIDLSFYSFHPEVKKRSTDMFEDIIKWKYLSMILRLITL